MANGFIKLEGIKELDRALENFKGNLVKTSEKSLRESLPPIENSMKTNASTMFNKGYAEGVMINSISHTISVDEDKNVYGSVGVFDMSNKTGTNDRRIKAPLLAFFYEGGIQPHSLYPGSRAARQITPSNPRGRAAVGQNTQPFHKGSPAIPFLTNAFESNAVNITDITIKNFNDAAETIQ